MRMGSVVEVSKVSKQSSAKNFLKLRKPIKKEPLLNQMCVIIDKAFSHIVYLYKSSTPENVHSFFLPHFARNNKKMA